MIKRPSITAFFPAYNDGGTIGSLVVTTLKTLEELTAGAADPAAALAAAGLHPVSKVLALDIAAAAPGYHHDKLEGATRVNGHTIAVINDDDFGVTEADGGMAIKHAPGSSTPDRNELLLLRVQLP